MRRGAVRRPRPPGRAPPAAMHRGRRARTRSTRASARARRPCCARQRAPRSSVARNGSGRPAGVDGVAVAPIEHGGGGQRDSVGRPCTRSSSTSVRPHAAPRRRRAPAAGATRPCRSRPHPSRRAGSRGQCRRGGSAKAAGAAAAARSARRAPARRRAAGRVCPPVRRARCREHGRPSTEAACARPAARSAASSARNASASCANTSTGEREHGRQHGQLDRGLARLPADHRSAAPTVSEATGSSRGTASVTATAPSAPARTRTLRARARGSTARTAGPGGAPRRPRGHPRSRRARPRWRRA